MKFLRSAILVAVLALCLMGIAFLFVLTRATAAVPKELSATRAALMAETHIAVMDANQRVSDALEKLDKQTGSALAEVHIASVNANDRTAEALDILRTTSVGVNKQLSGIRTDLNADLKPSLDNTAALVKDAQDSLDDSYWDIKANIESAAVTTHSIALASEAIANAAPSVSASVVGIGKSANGIAADAHTATSEFIKPKTKWQQFQSLLLTFARLYGAI